jgi:hypothetical protein
MPRRGGDRGRQIDAVPIRAGTFDAEWILIDRDRGDIG